MNKELKAKSLKLKVKNSKSLDVLLAFSLQLLAFSCVPTGGRKS
jgi:hypothetical protein